MSGRLSSVQLHVWADVRSCHREARSVRPAARASADRQAGCVRNGEEVYGAQERQEKATSVSSSPQETICSVPRQKRAAVWCYKLSRCVLTRLKNTSENQLPRRRCVKTYLSSKTMDQLPHKSRKKKKKKKLRLIHKTKVFSSVSISWQIRKTHASTSAYVSIF